MDTGRPSLFPLTDVARPKEPDAWAPMLSIRLATQKYFAIRLGNLLWIDYDPSGRMAIRFSTHTVHVEGRGLDPLYEQLLKLQCREIVVATDDSDAPPGALVVTRVEVERKPGRDEA